MAVKLSDTKTRDKLKTLLNEGMITYAERDAADRVVRFYEAYIDIKVGEPCLLTEFKYIDGDGGTSNLVLATRESIASWPNVDFDALP